MDVLLEKPWLAKYPTEIPHHINYEEKPLFAFLEEAAMNAPEKVAVHFLGKELTYKELYLSSLKLANYIKGLGVRKGDRVSIMLPNCPQAVISYYGALLSGAIVVQTNPMYTERELQFQLVDSGSKWIICLDLLYPKVVKVKASTEIDHIIVTSISDYLPFPKNLIYPFIQKKQHGIKVQVTHGAKTHLFQQALKNSSTEKIPLEINPKQDLALLQYTGGTTGQAKGVMLTHYNLVANTTMCINWMYKMKKGEERILGILPFFHVFGMTVVMNLAIMHESKMILLPRFDVEDTLKTIENQKPTIFPGAPTIFIALLNHPDIVDYDLSSIDSCISGSAPLPIEVQESFEEITGGKLVEGYGLTEASPVTHANFLWDIRPRVKGSIGVPWPDTEAFILSLEKNGPAEPNEIGEIVIRGPQVMKGYWNQDDETAASFFEGEWLLTGDLGYMDEQGYFYIVDRKKDMIIAGGFNIYPREIEEVLYEHESIKETVVVGIPDPYRGETVKAYVVLKDNESVTEEQLERHCREYLAAYKVPKIFEFRKELPKTAVGKIVRRVLVEEAKKQT
ncbi:AMP-binding protein [Schinkia azotoformans]|uniref:AMP-binding protein n=1 Tax=Schinkia azotoformans TaxID=1454 RepID=UPI002DBBA913|nr:AMP-binding protein [Schinkia azotoformans]MEC1720423.1 AMP-binding protein [Schinkia azotoformans]MED4413959.1 AMP-binding protein [Schinkia azotoformans]